MAEHRHKRETPARRRPRAVFIAAPLAVAATAATVSLGVLAGGTTPAAAPAAAEATADQSATASVAAPSQDVASAVRRKVVSRSGSRFEIKPMSKVEKLLAPAAVRKAVAGAEKKLWATEDLNLWSSPVEDATKIGTVEAGTQVLVTGRAHAEREEIVVGGKARWVTAGYLSAEEPRTLDGDCTNGTSVPSSVSENIVKVHRAVCAAFPEITTYGTFRSDGEHGQGIAVDIMVSGALGWEIADLLRENHADLGISYLIYEQKIWSVERSGEGWRGMSDRGSATANHYDHVHVTTY